MALALIGVVAATVDLAGPVVRRILSFPLDDAVNTASVAPNSSAVTLRYTCGFPYIGSEPMVAVVVWNTPASIQVGQPVPRLALSVQATVPFRVVWGLNVISVSSFDGTADVNGDIRVLQGDIARKVTLDVPRTSVPSSGSMTVPANGATPAVSFDQAGQAKVHAGEVTLHLQGYDSSGSPRQPPLNVNCTLDPGQSDVVATFDITPADPSPSPPTQVPSSHTTSTSHGTYPSRPSASSVPSSIDAIAPPSVSDTVATDSTVPADPAAASVLGATSAITAPAASSGGLGVVDWLLLVGGLLVVGSAGTMGVSRLRKRRGEGGAAR